MVIRAKFKALYIGVLKGGQYCSMLDREKAKQFKDKKEAMHFMYGIEAVDRTFNSNQWEVVK